MPLYNAMFEVTRMHKRIAQVLAGATDEYEYVDGTSAVSYTASEENSLYNIRIYGNAEMIKGAVGALSSTNKNYELYVRIHGENFLGGNELVNCAVQNLNEKFEYDLYGNQLTYTFHSITSEDYITVPNQPAFKENTVYTVRFRYTGIPNSSTGIKIRYTDGYEEDILSSDEEDSAIAFTTVMGKTVSCIAPSDALPDWGMIYLNTFGIFEGKTGYNYFEEYNAQTYTLKIEQPLAGIRKGIKSY